ncbi:glycosyltransferase [Mitsuaria sp. WAJ17]|uniref:glycosyltransferase family 2 protein n=1 Tax=Mitsuaria sp. WAJ17 TaxID=2761452 RepID=UPI0015FF3FFE|nr:glycosyltransferase family 2 protein [Mitsuaria sp. WAJ17]MBB2487056.1 glycosyltransferase [Mitsuaria sp. WAJ17]
MLTLVLLLALLGLLLPLILPALALLLLVASAWRACPRARREQLDRPRGPLLILVPAHDEADHIQDTVHALRSQLAPGDRLLVVADNCADLTAERARQAGAEVLERWDPQRRGKGYALAHGVDHLRQAPPALVLVVDADCRLSPGAAQRIAEVCAATRRPVQMLDLMRAAGAAGLMPRILEFAMRVKNQVRPLGTSALGDACHLMGTGMALPWPLLAQAPLASGHVAEDMELGLWLTRTGHTPCFLPEVRVTSGFAPQTGALRRQKTRWEHGHLAVMRQHAKPLLAQALRQGRAAPLALALDLLIPPLALYVLLLGGTSLGWAALLTWGTLPAPVLQLGSLLMGAGLGALVLALTGAWWRWGRDLLGPLELLSLPLYALWKLPIYVAYACGRASGWERGGRPLRHEGDPS